MSKIWGYHEGPRRKGLLMEEVKATEVWVIVTTESSLPDCCITSLLQMKP